MDSCPLPQLCVENGKPHKERNDCNASSWTMCSMPQVCHVWRCTRDTQTLPVSPLFPPTTLDCSSRRNCFPARVRGMMVCSSGWIRDEIAYVHNRSHKLENERDQCHPKCGGHSQTGAPCEKIATFGPWPCGPVQHCAAHKHKVVPTAFCPATMALPRTRTCTHENTNARKSAASVLCCNA